MRDLIRKTDDEIETAFDELGAGICVEDLVFTRETIEQFKASAQGYHDHGEMVEDEGTLIVENAQPRKGDSRANLYVVDFGEVRATFR